MNAARGSRSARQVHRQTVLGLVAMAAAGAALAAGSLTGAGASRAAGAQAGAAPVPLTVTARAGRLALSRASVPAGAAVAVTFVNRTPAAHVLSLAGRRTAVVAAGASATLAVSFAKAGAASVSCGLAGHAAKGERATLQVTAPAAPRSAPATTAPATTAPATAPAATTASAPAATTAPAPAPASTPTVPAGAMSLPGDPVAGRALWLANDCGSCHALAAPGATGSSAANIDLMKPSREAVVQATALGASESTNVMKAYPLSAAELASLAAFVEQASQAG